MAYRDRIQRIASGIEPGYRRAVKSPQVDPDRRFRQYETRMRNIARSGEGLA